MTTKKKVTKRVGTVSIPERLPKESRSEHRVRIVKFLLEQEGPISIDELTIKYVQHVGPISKENVRNAVDTLEKRSMAQYTLYPEDKRVRLWEAI